MPTHLIITITIQLAWQDVRLTLKHPLVLLILALKQLLHSKAGRQLGLLEYSQPVDGLRKAATTLI